MKYRHNEYGLKWMILIFLFCIFGSVACDNKNQIAEVNSKEASQLEQDNRVSKAPQPDDRKIEYNPALCKTDAKDKVYFALGRTVFEVDAEHIDLIYTLDNRNRFNNLNLDREGCYGNPIIARSFSFPSEDVEFNRLMSKPNKISLRRLAILSRSLEASRSNKTRGAQQSHQNIFDKIKNQFGNCVNDSNSGFSVCWLDNNMGRSFNPNEPNPSVFKAMPGIYDTPLEGPLVVDCTQILSSVYQGCFVDYDFNDSFKVSYKFTLNSGTIQDVLNFDDLLRKRIKHMQVSDYQWPVNDK